MGAPIVSGDDFDVLVTLAVVLLVLNPKVRKVHAVVEVRQFVFPGPLLDLPRIAIGPPVVVVAVPVPLVEPLLVLALELVIESHALDASTALLEPLRLAAIGAIELGVVFQLALAFQAGVERLVMAPLAVAVGFEKVPAALGEDHGLLPIAGDADRLDEALFPQVTEVAVTRVARPIRMVTQVARRHDAKRANGGERPTLGPAQRVFAVARIVDDLAVAPARQIEPSREHIAWVDVALPGLAIAVRPARIVTIAMIVTVAGITAVIIPVAPFVVVVVDPRSAWSTSERERVIVIAVALVSVSRVACVVVITRVEVEHRLPPRPAFGRCCFVNRLRRCSREALAATERQDQ